MTVPPFQSCSAYLCIPPTSRVCRASFLLFALHPFFALADSWGHRRLYPMRVPSLDSLTSPTPHIFGNFLSCSWPQISPRCPTPKFPFPMKPQARHRATTLELALLFCINGRAMPSLAPPCNWVISFGPVRHSPGSAAEKEAPFAPILIRRTDECHHMSSQFLWF